MVCFVLCCRAVRHMCLSCRVHAGLLGLQTVESSVGKVIEGVRKVVNVSKVLGLQAVVDCFEKLSNHMLAYMGVVS